MTRTRMPKAYNLSDLDGLKDEIREMTPYKSRYIKSYYTPDFQYIWNKDRYDRYYLGFELYLGRCPFPQILFFRGEPGYYIEVECFNKKPQEISERSNLILNRSIPPFTVETTTPYMFSRLAYIIQLFCRGDDHQYDPTTGSLYDNRESNIHLSTIGSAMTVKISHPIEGENEIELWDAQFFPPDGIDTVVKLINDIRYVSMTYFW